MIKLCKRVKDKKTTMWIGEITEDGLLIRHGTENRSLRTITIPAAGCTGGPAAHLDTLVAQQVKDGYAIVDGDTPETVRAIQRAQQEIATKEIKEALSKIEPTSCATW